MSIFEAILHFLVAMSMSILSIVNPEKARAGKRAMFLTSVYIKLVNDGILQEMSLEAFNDAFNLAEDSQTLEAARAATGVWDKRNLDGKLKRSLDSSDKTLETKEERLTAVEDFCPHVISMTPRWMRYDDEAMKEELADVLLVSGFRKEIKDSTGHMA